jgi:hypothetical protein
MQKYGLRASSALVLAAICLLCFSGAAFASTWTDLSESTLHGYGITSDQVSQISVGFPSGLWLPDKTISRAQFVKMADAAFDIPSATPALPTYPDVLSETSYFYGYIEGATAAGLIGGYPDGLFRPGASITRQQAIAIVAREAAAANGFNLEALYTQAEADAVLAGFADGSAVSAGLRKAVAFAAEYGIASGNASGGLRPQASVTRIQAAALLIRAGAPRIASISPHSGSASGGTSVTITGIGFAGLSEQGAVRFGMNDALSYTVDSPTQITATAPAGGAGTSVPISVTNPAGTLTAVSADLYSYVFTTPTVTSVTPGSGPVGGGNLVTINGDALTDVTAVWFGTVQATNFIVVSPKQITATVPAGAAGETVDVTVVGPAGRSEVSAADRDMYGQPAVFSVAPAAGPVGGGNTVIITGVGLSGASAVMFGFASASGYTVNSATQITVVAPAGSDGTTVDITVVGLAGASLPVAGSRYTYGPPLVSSISPSAGPSSGSTSVVIRGTGFTGLNGPTAVRFGPRNALSYTVISDTEIIAVAPSGTAGTAVTVTVTNPAGISPTVALYLYYDA